MARSRTSSALAVRTVRAPSPIIRIAAPRAVSSPKSRRSRRRSSGSSGTSGGPLELAVSGALVGFAYKYGLVDKLPSLPVIGRMGTLALAADYYSKHGGGQTARRVAVVAAILAGYQLGREGSISGDDDAEASGYAYTDGDDDDA